MLRTLRQIFIVGCLLVAIITATIVLPSRPEAAQAAVTCTTLSGSSYFDVFLHYASESVNVQVGDTVSVTAPGGISMQLPDFTVVGGGGPITATMPGTIIISMANSTPFTYTVTHCTGVPDSGVPDSGGLFQDGRLCHWDSYAVYSTDETIDVYGQWESEGYFVLRVTQEELDSHPGAEGVNTLIKSSDDGEVQVYRLGTTDTLEVHAGLDFVRFTGLPGSNKFCGTVDLSGQ